MAALSHIKSNTLGDFTGTVTVNNSAGATATVAATNLVRPSDWNSAHNFYQTVSGRSFGDASTASGTNLVFGGSNLCGVGLSTGANAATLWFDPVNYTALTYQNRQLGASTTLQHTQNAIWMVPFRVQAPVSGSTLAVMMSYSGTITSAATAQAGQSLEFGIYSQNATNATRWDTWWTAGRSITFWNSGTSSYSFNYGGTTSSSAGSNIGTANVMGMRLHNIPLNSVVTPGIYMFGLRVSTSTAGYSAAMSRLALVMDNPLSIGMGTFNQATNASIGYVDAGTYSTTSAALPASVAMSQIVQFNNVVPYFKIGAI